VTALRAQNGVPRPWRRRRLARGVTLIEILVVLSIIALMMGALISGTGRSNSARLRQSASLVSGAIRVAYSRASATSKPVRLVFDFQENTLVLEESNGAMFTKRGDKTGTGGADPSTVLEKEAAAEAERIAKGVTAPRATFKAVVDQGFGKGPKALPTNIEFRSMQTDHDDEARVQGRAYLYFWPGGQTERAIVQMRIHEASGEGDTLSLVVSPLTGKVVVKPGAVAFEPPAALDGKDTIVERTAPGGN
jgi:general secretion pathway protein H